MRKPKSLRVLFLLAAVVAATLSAARSFAAPITVWTFDNVPIGANNSPAPATGAGTATALGMTNGYTLSAKDAMNNPIVGSVNTDDVLALAGSSTNSPTDQAWRVRGSALNTGPNTGNGWALDAPERTQGVEFDTSTAGFKNIVFSYDWFTTNQGVKNQQPQYTSDGSTWIDVGPVLIATPNNFNNGESVDFGALGIHSVDNNPNFGVRLVSVYDPALGSYGGASGGPYNNSSGNWRFDNVAISGAAVPEPATMFLAVAGLAALVLCGGRRRFDG